MLGSKDSDHRVIVKDGVAWMPGFESFAGSVSSMLKVLRIAVQRCNIPLRDAVLMATRTPATIMGLSHKGRLEPGCDADCILLDQNLQLTCVIQHGQRIINQKEAK